jgi:hypothetical protein
MGESLFVQMFTSSGCPNSLDEGVLAGIQDNTMRDSCRTVHQSVLSHVRARQAFYDYVILSDQNWSGLKYSQSAVELTNKVKSTGSKTIILGQPPTNSDVFNCLNRDYSNYSSCSNTRKSSISDYTVAADSKVAFGDISDLFCLETFCPLLINDAPTSAMGHLTDVSAASIAPYFLDFLRDAKVPSK